jgi:chlorobactene glucosyltransferase
MNIIPFLSDSHRLLVFVGVQWTIAVSNSILMRPLRSFRRADREPRVSVLVPARDEAQTIGRCVRSLLAQDYPDFEVVVMDDGSRDRTGLVLAGIGSDRLRVLTGRTLPDGWTGKTWACWQLAEAATGELLFFTDADTVHEPDTLRQAVAALESSNAEFITAVARNEVRTFGEQVTVPFIIWAPMAILPLGLSYLLRRSRAFSVAGGKFMLFRRAAYDHVGGHAAVRTEAAEDVAICRRVKASGMKWRLLDATECVSARMYDGFKTAVHGFSKNFFALFDYRVVVALFVWYWMLLITWHPLVFSIVRGLRHDFSAQFWSAVATVLLAAAIWLLVAIKTRMPRHLFLLYPVTMTVAAGLGIWSMALTIAGRTSWKDRSLVRHRIRLV